MPLPLSENTCGMEYHKDRFSGSASRHPGRKGERMNSSRSKENARCIMRVCVYLFVRVHIYARVHLK